MEMQEIEVEPEDKTDEGATGPKLEDKKAEKDEEKTGLKPEDKTEEEAEPDHYTKLNEPTENVYSETYYFQPNKTTPSNPPEGNVRLYRAGCLFLSLLCFVLLLAVIILSMKLQTGSTFCPDSKQTLDASGRSSPACSLDRCVDDFPDIWPRRLGCQQCANGWLTYGRSCFFLSTFRLTWTESQKNCSSRGGHLAVISSRTVQTFLTEKGDLKYWIGLKNSGTTWTWIDNKALQRSYWSEVPLDGDCGILSSTDPAEKNWIRASCRASSYFICQLQL